MQKIIYQIDLHRNMGDIKDSNSTIIKSPIIYKLINSNYLKYKLLNQC